MSPIPETLARRVADAHAAREFLVAPPASEAEIAAFEHRHRITLPPDYRWFLLNIGNGGYGPPYYGIEPLSDRLIEANSSLDPSRNHNDRLSEPFPAQEADWADQDLEAADAAWSAYEAGRLLLGTHGCGILWLLVVSGEASGEVWQLDEDAAERVAPSFLDWYARWLDERREPRPDDPVPLALARRWDVRLGRLVRRLRGSAA
jgi:hypothetical protein